MTYQISDFTDAAGVEDFEFTTPDGKTWAIRSFNLMTGREIKKIAQAAARDDLDPLIEVVSGGDEELNEILWDLPLRAITDLYKAWQAQAGVTQGESRTSSRS